MKTLQVSFQDKSDVEKLLSSSGTELHEQNCLHWPCKATAQVQRSSQKSS